MGSNNQFIVLENGDDGGDKGKQQGSQRETQINNTKQWAEQTFNEGKMEKSKDQQGKEKLKVIKMGRKSKDTTKGKIQRKVRRN